MTTPTLAALDALSAALATLRAEVEREQADGPEPWLPLAAAAEWAGVGPSALRDAIARGDLPADGWGRLGHAVVVRRSAVEAALARGREARPVSGRAARGGVRTGTKRERRADPVRERAVAAVASLRAVGRGR